MSTASDKAPSCIRCGKPLTGRSWGWLNYDATTHTPIAPDAAPAHGEYGAHPIGRDCARALAVPRAWIIPAD